MGPGSRFRNSSGRQPVAGVPAVSGTNVSSILEKCSDVSVLEDGRTSPLLDTTKA